MSTKALPGAGPDHRPVRAFIIEVTTWRKEYLTVEVEASVGGAAKRLAKDHLASEGICVLRFNRVQKRKSHRRGEGDDTHAR